jgi:hypothetical protein
LRRINEEVVMNSEGCDQIFTRKEHPKVTPPPLNLHRVHQVRSVTMGLFENSKFKPTE